MILSAFVRVFGLCVLILSCCIVSFAADRVFEAEGTAGAVSPFPDPAKSDYPNCYYTVEFTINHVMSGGDLPETVVLLFPAFMGQKKTPLSNVKTGEKYRVRLTPFEELDDKRKSIQQADTLDLFNAERFLVLDAAVIHLFSNEGVAPVTYAGGGDYVSIYQSHLNPPEPRDRIEKRAAFLKSELARMEKLCAEVEGREGVWNTRFNAAWKAEQDRDAAGRNRAGGRVWRQTGNAWFAMPSVFTFIRTAPPLVLPQNLDAIVNLNNALSANGIELILQIIPDLDDIAARAVNPEFRSVPDYHSAAIARQLLRAGVEALYTSDRLIQHLDRHPFMFFYPANYHPADGCQDIITDQMAAHLTERFGRFKPNCDPSKFSVKMGKSVNGTAFSFPANCDIGQHRAGEMILCRNILYDGKDVVYPHDSPVMVIGNSFIQHPMETESYSANLAMKLGCIPDNYRLDCYGPMTSIIQSIFNNRSRYLSGKKVVIMPLGVTHLNTGIKWTDLRILDEAQKKAAAKKVE